MSEAVVLMQMQNRFAQEGYERMVAKYSKKDGEGMEAEDAKETLVNENEAQMIQQAYTQSRLLKHHSTSFAASRLLRTERANSMNATAADAAAAAMGMQSAALEAIRGHPHPGNQAAHRGSNESGPHRLSVLSNANNNSQAPTPTRNSQQALGSQCHSPRSRSSTNQHPIPTPAGFEHPIHVAVPPAPADAPSPGSCPSAYPLKPQVQHMSFDGPFELRRLGITVLPGGNVVPRFGFVQGLFSWLREETPSLLQRIDQLLPFENPSSRRRRYWDLFLLIFVIWNAMVVPYDVSYGTPNVHALQTFEWWINSLFMVDICYNLRTGFVDSHGKVVRDSKRIFWRYASFWLPVDVLASVPFNSFAESFGVSPKQLRLLAFLKTPRLLRLGRLLRFLEKMKNANIFRIVRLLGAMFLMGHWLACVWYMLYVYFPQHSWFFTAMQADGLATRYMAAFYQSLLLMMGSSVTPLNNIERTFFITVMVFGAAFYASVVGNMALLVSNLSATRSRHKQRKDLVSDAMRYFQIPPHLQARVHSYFDYLSSFSHPGTEGMAFLAELPKTLHYDITNWAHTPNLSKVPLFAGCEPAFLMQLTARIKMTVYLPGEKVYRVKEMGHEMYVLRKGSVALVNQHGEMVDMLGAGSSFGELAVLTAAPRGTNCVALAYCDVAVVSTADLQHLMRDYPASAEVIKAQALKQLQQAEASGLEPLALNNMLIPIINNGDRAGASSLPNLSTARPVVVPNNLHGFFDSPSGTDAAVASVGTNMWPGLGPERPPDQLLPRMSAGLSHLPLPDYNMPHMASSMAVELDRTACNGATTGSMVDHQDAQNPGDAGIPAAQMQRHLSGVSSLLDSLICQVLRMEDKLQAVTTKLQVIEGRLAGPKPDSILGTGDVGSAVTPDRKLAAAGGKSMMVFRAKTQGNNGNLMRQAAKALMAAKRLSSATPLTKQTSNTRGGSHGSTQRGDARELGLGE